MNKLKELKKEYDSTPIPEELSHIVNKTIEDARLEGVTYGENQGENMNELKNKPLKKKHTARILVSSVAALAIVVGSFAVGVNTSPSFAASMNNVPILGSLVKIFTGQETSTSDNVAKVDMRLPAVEGIADKKFEATLNQEILDKMNEVAMESEQRAAENKEAWLATGGVESEYRPVEITIDYEVKAISETVLSFTVFKMETSASAYAETFYYNIDLENSETIQLDAYLKEQLGDDYIAIASKQIADEIAIRSQDENATYWDGSDGIDGFKSITGQENFFINEKGNAVIEFNKYEIAPGYMGIQDFEITK